mmetsp:Transcript_12944/g.36290  ORF Transcript_12944/g.36290 Transcript_12944/m.36290 type:complete len:228 (-) Transcript_12944:264-947(-)
MLAGFDNDDGDDVDVPLARCGRPGEGGDQERERESRRNPGGEEQGSGLPGSDTLHGGVGQVHGGESLVRAPGLARRRPRREDREDGSAQAALLPAGGPAAEAGRAKAGLDALPEPRAGPDVLPAPGSGRDGEGGALPPAVLQGGGAVPGGHAFAARAQGQRRAGGGEGGADAGLARAGTLWGRRGCLRRRRAGRGRRRGNQADSGLAHRSRGLQVVGRRVQVFQGSS